MKTLHFPLSLLAALLLLGTPLQAESEATQAIADRYEQLLVRSPQAGSAFDRVVDWYTTEGGGLEVLQKRWQDAAGQAETRRSYLILQGLLAERLRSPKKAREFYQQALAETGDPAQAARLLATLETTEGNFPAAAAAYQKALGAESLAPVDRMEIMRSLALLYQRAFEDDKALDVWRDAMKRYPEDPYVLEEAGEAFLAAGSYEDARKTFTKLRDASASDPFRKVAASLRLARTAELEGKTDEAVKTYELALEETSEGSWINREVRARIEELFRRKDDLPGLLAYYEKRTTAVPQDYQSLAAQGEVLDDLGRTSESIDRIRAATELAPDNVELRLSLISRLNSSGKIDEALTEAEELAKPANAPAETLVVLGNLYWTKYQAKKDEKSRDAAIAAWQRIAPDGSTDAARIAQFAEILVAHDLTDQALAQWQRIIAVSPGASDARQRVAEVLQKKGDQKGAEAALEGIVQEDRAQPENFLLLARIQDRLTWPEAARATTQKGLSLFPNDYELLNLAWRQASEAKDKKAVEELFPGLWKNAPNEFFAEDASKRYVSFLELEGASKETSEKLAERLKGEDATAAMDAVVLFRIALSEKDQALAESALAVLNKLDNKVRAARAGAELAQAFGTPEEQVKAQEAVAAADPRMAGDSMRLAARILADNGKTDEALAVVSKLIERTPADATLYGLYADLAARAGKYDEAVIRLNEAIRYVEDASTLRLQLAAMLQAQERNTEAAKVLQEAFEKEEKDGRRMEIFRRQIDLATQAGTQDDLIASIREKQAKEQNGARYGAYLAEIYILQNDLIAAREELARSLGRNPDSTAAVARLLDLADRGGDQQEGLRLSARLVELQPSRDNRVAYISRLFDANEIEKAQSEFEKAKSDVLKDPTGWSAVLNSMRKAGFDKQSDSIVEEIAMTGSTGVEQKAELAELRLMQRDYAGAEKNLWEVVESGDFAGSLKAVAAEGSSSAPSYLGSSAYWLRYQPFQQLLNEAQMSLQQMFLQYRGRGFGRMFYRYPGMGVSTSSVKATPEQNAQVKAFFMLAQLARAQGREKEFFNKAEQVFAAGGVPRDLQYLALTPLNHPEGLKKIALAQAEEAQGDVELDKFIISTGSLSAPEQKESLEKIQKRLEKNDPKFAFEQLMAKTSQELAASGAFQNMGKKVELTPEQKAKYDALLNHPVLASSPIARLQIANVAASIGDLDTAFRLLDQTVAESEEMRKKGGQAAQIFDQQWTAAQNSILLGAIRNNDPKAKERFEKLVGDLSIRGPKGLNSPLMAYRMYGGVAPNMLAQATPDLAIGDRQFPLWLFRVMVPAVPSEQADMVQAWFVKNAKGSELDSYEIGAFYGLWLAGKKDEAVKRLEAIHQKNPTPRSAALLLEAYEKQSATDKALALLDLAELQDTETAEVRNLRKIRLLRAAAKNEEAKALAEKLARGRVSSAVRDQLANEMNLLGIPPTQYQNLSSAGVMRSRGSRDRGSQLREQINRLVQDNKKEEAKEFVLQILQRPLPQKDDYNEANLRQNMVSQLRSMKMSDGLEGALQDRLAKDPADVDAAIRLAELTMNDDADVAGNRLAATLKAHPQRVAGFGYALQLLQRSGDGQEKIAEMVAALLKDSPDALLASGIQLNEILSYAGNPKSGLLVANAVAGMSEENYEKFFMPARLSGQQMEAQVLTQLAEVSVQGGNTDQAIALLQRAIEKSNVGLDQSLMASMRLAELQIAMGRKEEAKKTMLALTETKAQNRGHFMGGSQSLGNVLYSLLMNRSPGGSSSDQILRLTKLAEQTETLDAILKAIEGQGQPGQGMSPSLMLRTMMGRPEIGAEWRKLLASGNLQSGYFYLPMASTVIKALSTQEDGAKLIPALLAKIPEQSYGNGGGDATLSTMAETLPLLTKYRDNPAVERHVDLLVAKTLADPNASRYLWQYPSYASGLNALIDYGRIEEAKKLYELSVAARASQNYGRNPALERLEARLAAAQGDAGAAQIVCAGVPLSADRLKVRWMTSIRVDEGEDYNNTPETALWEESGPPVAKKARPTSLEIYAGANPAALEKVAQIANPPISGAKDVAVKSPMGLLQAVWTLPDGSKSWGPLTAYVTGTNLVERNGVPEAKGPLSTANFQVDQPGPLGEKSAVIYKGSGAQPQIVLPLSSLPLDGTPQILVMSGWLRGSGPYGNMPNVVIKWSKEGGRDDNDGTYSRQAGEGQWRQFFKIWALGKPFDGFRQIDKATQMTTTLSLSATGGYNSMYQFDAGWDGLQIVKLPMPPEGEDARAAIKKGRDAWQNKNYDASIEAYTKAFRMNPTVTLQQLGASICEPFEKSGKLNELFGMLSSPALYLGNPLNDNRATVDSGDLIGRLAQAALGKEAPAGAKQWLRQMQSGPLSAKQRFIIETALMQEELAQAPEKADAKKLLAALGFGEKPDRERIQQLWSVSRSAQPALQVLDIADQQNKNAEMSKQLKALVVPVELMAAQQMLAAWLIAPEDAKAAVELWKQSLAMRETQNSASFNDDADRALLLRIAKTYPSPHDLIVAMKVWLGKRSYSADYQQRTLVEMLYAASLQESANRAEYEKLWADAELAALKSESYNPSRDRIREMARKLMEAGEWERLESLLALANTNRALKSSAIQREFKQLRDLAAFSKGGYDIAWPVAWSQAGKDPLKVTVRWQWNTRDIVPDQGKYDTAVSLSDKPILPRIPKQQRVELWFGEMPKEMKLVGQVEGESATGSLDVDLPVANGFLRAVAVFADKRVEGPVVPILSGRKIFPEKGVSLKDMLASGSKPLAAQILTDAGQAPDGSPAIRIGVVGESEQLSYAGPDFDAKPGKFYVLKSWSRRVGGGSTSVLAEFKGSDSDRSLNMILSERYEATAQWVYYARAIPSFPQHTFWVPYETVVSLGPRLWDVDPGSEIAGLELLEIEGWKYGEWIGELAMIRKNSGETADSATLDRAMTLAAIEPLTSLDYHGDWLGVQAVKAGRGADLVKLYRDAFAAEPNPLFARPKLGRMYNYAISVIDKPETPADVRWNLAQVLYENRDRAGVGTWLAIQNRYLAQAGDNGAKELALGAVRGDLKKKLSESDKGTDFLNAAVKARNYKDLRPTSELLSLLLLLGDESELRSVKETVEKSNNSGLEASDRIFAALAMEAKLSDGKVDESWKNKITKGYLLSEKSSNPAVVMFWPSLLGDVLTDKKLSPEMLFHLRQRGFERMLLAKPDQTSYSEELIRSGGLLIDAGLAQGNEKAVSDTVASLQGALQARSNKLNEASLRLMLAPIEQLAAAGQTAQSEALVSLVEKDVRDTKALADPYAKYLKPASATATP